MKKFSLIIIISLLTVFNSLSATFNRPQTPIAPYPYDTTDISIINPLDGTRLNGTLTYPSERKAKAAIVLASGSGAQDRDEQIFGHRPFKVIADFLTRNGYAVFRFDDRIYNCTDTDSALNFTTDSFLSDVLSSVDYLKKQGYPKVGIIGHSEGGTIAIKAAASDKDTDFIITLAAPAFRGDSIILSQTRTLLEKQGAGTAWNTMYCPMLKRRYNLAMSSLTTDSLKNALYKEVTGNILPGMLNQQMIDKIKSEIAVMASDWYREMLRYNPTDDISNIKIDWLALNGKKDIQVLPDNLDRIKELNPNTTIVSFDNLNHLFQNCSTGLLDEYSTIEETFSEDALNTILRWLDSLFASSPQ